MISPLREELGAVLRDPVFARSPALSRLLAYLVEASARGEGASLKSYTVAVEGLGKSPDFDSQVNTSARVLVARLRRALDSFYAGAGAGRSLRLAIETGSYEVRLEDNPHFRRGGQAATDPAPVPAPVPVRAEAPVPRASRLRWPKIAAVLLLLAAMATGLAWFWRRPASDEAQWKVARFPSVYFEFADDGSAAARRYLESIRIASLDETGRYEVIRPAGRRDATVDYVIRLRTETAGAGLTVRIMVIDQAVNRIIHASDLAFESPQDFERNGMHRIGETYFGLLGYRGAIVSQERKRVGLDEGAYGCWLRFSADALADGGFGDRALDACAARWHAQAPDHPVATAIYGWTLTSDTFGDISAQGRMARLDKVIDMLERARTLYPDSRHVLLALARAYAFRGDFAALQEVAASLEQKGGYNLDVMNTVGTFLVLQNNMRGIALIDHAIGHNPDPPGRFFIGKFIAAMMNDDMDAAGAAIARIRTQRHTSVMSQVLQTAYEAHMGNLEAARASWELAKEDKAILRLYPGAFLTALPASPPIRAKLREWLLPVVPGL